MFPNLHRYNWIII